MDTVMNSVRHFHVPGEAARREYAVYLIVARHRLLKCVRVRIYVGKTGDIREGCNPLISRAGNHLSFNTIHSQSRNHLGNPEEYDFDFFFTTFGNYVPPSQSREGIELVNEMERQLNHLAQKELGEIVNPLKLNGYVLKSKRETRVLLAKPERMDQLQELVARVKSFIHATPQPMVPNICSGKDLDCAVNQMNCQ
jgi:hypothetical protein